MRSSVSAALVAALLTGGCGAGWRDPPLAPANMLPPSGPAEPALHEPGQPDPADPGTSYPPPGRPAPARPPGGEQIPSAVAVAPAQRAPAYDNVGYAIWSPGAGPVSAAHPSLPLGSFVEVTVLNTGRTILVPITARSRPGREIELSGGAAQELGLQGGRAPVRVRIGNPTGADLAALGAGRPAPARPDTPPVLLNALRRKLDGSLGRVTADFDDGSGPAPARTPAVPPRPGATAAARPAPAAPSSRPNAPPVARSVPATPAAPRVGPGYYVQIAALGDVARARTLARSVGGAVSSSGGLHRVRVGPFADARAAQAARDGVVRRGYGDARIVRE